MTNPQLTSEKEDKKISPLTNVIRMFIPEDDIREKIDEDLADRVSLNPAFLEDILIIRKKEWAKADVYFDEFELYNCDLGLGYILDDEGYHEDVNPPLSKEIYSVLKKYSLPEHFFTWVLNWIDKNKKPEIVPNGWWYKSGRIDRYLESKSGLTTQEKKQFINDIKMMIFLLKEKGGEEKKVKKYETLLIEYKERIKSAPVSVHRKKRIPAKLIKKQIAFYGKYSGINDRGNKVLHTSKSIALENYGEDTEPTEKDLKREAARIRKMKSNLRKIK
jgi:hypothetical protein